MPIVTFWSNTQKTIGQTVTMSSVTTAMAMDCSYKILLISADVNNNQLEKNFGMQQNNTGLLHSLMPSKPRIDIDSGIEGLLRLTRTNRLSPELIKDYTKVIINNRLEILYTPSLMGKDINELLDCFKQIITNAAQYYDYVFVDLKKGVNLPRIWEILEASDVIVFDTMQNQEQMANFMKINQAQNLLTNNKVIWSIGKFNGESKYTVKNLSKGLWKNDTIYTIEYNTELFEATQEGRLANFLLDIRSSKGKNKNSYILEEIRALMKGIIDRFEILRKNR